MKRLLSTKLSFGIIGAIVGTGLGLAVTGGFPDGMQDPLANAVRHVGINLPGGADAHPAARVPSDQTADTGHAFQVPTGGLREDEPRRYSSGGGYENSCYASAACRAYFGLDQEEEDETVQFVPQPQGDGGGHNPGQLGEPGQPGIPDEGDDESGDSDGTPGEGGPAGEPG